MSLSHHPLGCQRIPGCDSVGERLMELDEHWAASGQRLVVTGRSDTIRKVCRELGISTLEIVKVNASKSSLALVDRQLEAYLQWRQIHRMTPSHQENEDQALEGSWKRRESSH